MGRTLMLIPRGENARGKVRGALPRIPARGTPPETPGPLSLLPHVPERSSRSRVSSEKSFQTRKRFSSAAHKPRALDRCGPFRRFNWDKGKGANAKANHSSLWPYTASRWSALQSTLLQNRTFHVLIKPDILTC